MTGYGFDSLQYHQMMNPGIVYAPYIPLSVMELDNVYTDDPIRNAYNKIMNRRRNMVDAQMREILAEEIKKEIDNNMLASLHLGEQ